MKTKLILILALVVATLAVAGCQAPLPGVLSGTVRDGAGTPKPDVIVAVYSTSSSVPVQTVTTGIDGAYSFVLPGANYRLGATDPMHGFYDYWYKGLGLSTAAKITVNGGAVTIDITMSPVSSGLAPFAGSGPTVAMAGDSITFWSTSAINAALASKYRYSVTGVNGYETEAAKWIIDGYAPLKPDVFVMDLGTNDSGRIARGTTTLADYESRVLAFVDELRGSCFVVTTITTHVTSATSDIADARNAAARDINDWLHATFPNNVIEWDTTVADALASGTVYLPDEIHPNGVGQKALASLVTSAAGRCTGT